MVANWFQMSGDVTLERHDHVPSASVIMHLVYMPRGRWYVYTNTMSIGWTEILDGGRDVVRRRFEQALQQLEDRFSDGGLTEVERLEREEKCF